MTTIGDFSLKFVIVILPSADNPTVIKPLLFNSSNALFKLTTLLTGICSKAPAATLATVPVNTDLL